MPSALSPVAPTLTDCIGQVTAAAAPLLLSNKALINRGTLIANAFTVPFNTTESVLNAYYGDSSLVVAGIKDIDKAIMGFRAAFVFSDTAIYNLAALFTHGSGHVRNAIEQEIVLLRRLKYKVLKYTKVAGTSNIATARALCVAEELCASVSSQLKSSNTFNIPQFTAAANALCGAVGAVDKDKAAILTLLGKISITDAQVVAYHNNMVNAKTALASKNLLNIAEYLIGVLDEIVKRITALKTQVNISTAEVNEGVAAEIDALCTTLNITLKLYKNVNSLLSKQTPVLASVVSHINTTTQTNCGDINGLKRVAELVPAFLADESARARLVTAINTRISFLTCFNRTIKTGASNVNTAVTAATGVEGTAVLGAHIFSFVRNYPQLKDSFNLSDLAGLLGLVQINVTGLDGYISALSCLAKACLNPYLQSNINAVLQSLNRELERRKAPFVTMNVLCNVPAGAVRIVINKRLDDIDRKVAQLNGYITANIDKLCKV